MRERERGRNRECLYLRRSLYSGLLSSSTQSIPTTVRRKMWSFGSDVGSLVTSNRGWKISLKIEQKRWLTTTNLNHQRKNYTEENVSQYIERKKERRTKNEREHTINHILHCLKVGQTIPFELFIKTRNLNKPTYLLQIKTNS